MSEQESTRRTILQVAGAALGGAIGGKGVEQAAKRLEKPDAIINTTVKAETPTQNKGQYKGGPMNQGHQENKQSPTGIQNQRKVVPGTQIGRAPKTNSNGLIFGTDFDDGIIEIYDLKNDQHINTINTNGGLNQGLWHNGNIIIGNPSGLHEYNPQTGEKTQTIKKDSRGALTKNNGTGYTGRSYGIAQFPLNNIEDITEHDAQGNPPIGALNILPEEDIAVRYGRGDLISRDLQNEKTIDIYEPQNTLQGEISTDGDHVFNATNNVIEAFEIPKTPEESFSKTAEAPFNGRAETPPVVIDEGSETWIYNGSFQDDGDGNYHVQGYKFKGNNLTQEWKQPVAGKIGEIVGMGDTVIASGGGIYGFNAKTGEEHFRNEDILGYVGMAWNNKIPVGDADKNGIYILDMEMTGGDGDDGGKDDNFPDIAVALDNVPEEPVNLGETIEYDVLIDNRETENLEIEFNNTYTSGDADKEYNQNFLLTVPERGLKITTQYTPVNYENKENTFQAEINEKGTNEVTVPTLVEDGKATNTITVSEGSA